MLAKEGFTPSRSCNERFQVMNELGVKIAVPVRMHPESEGLTSKLAGVYLLASCWLHRTSDAHS